MVALLVKGMRGEGVVRIKSILLVSIVRVYCREIVRLAHQPQQEKEETRESFCDAILMAHHQLEFSWWKM
jgi:hypothetical protein